MEFDDSLLFETKLQLSFLTPSKISSISVTPSTCGNLWIECMNYKKRKRSKFMCVTVSVRIWPFLAPLMIFYSSLPDLESLRLNSKRHLSWAPLSCSFYLVLSKVSHWQDWKNGRRESLEYWFPPHPILIPLSLCLGLSSFTPLEISSISLFCMIIDLTKFK